MVGQVSENKQLWWAALKLPMYSVAIMPILLGTALAWVNEKNIYWDRLGCFLVAAVLILVWENLSNDVFDDQTGIDVHKYHSVVKLLGNRSGVLVIANCFLLLGIGALCLIIWQQQDLTVLGLVLTCCALGYCYQGPPFRFGYQGFGEILCFLSFGPLAVSAAYYSQSQNFDQSIWLPAIINGITTSLILFCSHFHQVEDDQSAGKISPVARLGTHRSAQLIPWLCLAVYALTTMGICLDVLPWSAIAIGVSLPGAWQLSDRTGRYHDQPAEIRDCKFIAIGLHFWSNVGLIIGLCYAL